MLHYATVDDASGGMPPVLASDEEAVLLAAGGKGEALGFAWCPSISSCDAAAGIR